MDRVNEFLEIASVEVLADARVESCLEDLSLVLTGGGIGDTILA